MLRISWQTLRARRASLSGAFVAIWLAVTLAYAAGLLMTGALSAPGPGRFAAADAVVRADPSIELAADESADAIPGPRVHAGLAARVADVAGVERAIGDVSFAVGAFAGGEAVHVGTGERLRGHGWSSAALTPVSGRAPAGPHEVVADARLGLRPGAALRIAAPAGEETFRVAALVRSRAGADNGERSLFFADATAARLSGTPGRVAAIGVVAERGVSSATLRARLAAALGGDLEVLDHEHASEADASDPNAADRAAMVAIFGTMGGISALVALFVVAGTFALAIAQRRRETAVLRALGATPRQVRRLIAFEALIVSLVAGGLGLLAGGPLAGALTGVLADHGTVPLGFEPGRSWIPLVAALGLGVVVAQLAVVAAAFRAGRTRPADALNDVAVEHARPGPVRVLTGVIALGGGVAMSLVFDGIWAQAFAILGGMLLAGGTGLLGRWLLGVPAAVLAWPLRRRGAAGLLASTGLAANRWRTAALATPVVLVTMLAGTWGLIQTSDQRHTEDVTAARVTAERVVVGRGGAPLPAAAATDVARLPGVRATAATIPTEVYGVRNGLSEMSPWAAAGLEVTGRLARTLDLRVTAGDLGDVRGRAVAVSRWVAADGDLAVGDTVRVRMADARPQRLRVAAIYARAAGLGQVVMDPGLARAHAAETNPAAVFVAGGPAAGRALERYADRHPGVASVTRAQFRAGLHGEASDQAWGVWLIIGLAGLFATLALVNTAAMSTAERRSELATVRLLGGTASHAIRTVALELGPTMLVALAAGAVVVAAAVAGVPRGASGFPLTVPLGLLGAFGGGAALLAVLAGTVTARLALRASPAEAMRTRE